MSIFTSHPPKINKKKLINDKEIINVINWQLECDLTPMEHEERAA